ncbi:unnamed protein product [Auanema sp. JU1783]|nr:unnamed protein product [Auanema sp. JU1783]
MYRFGFNETQQLTFGKIAIYCDTKLDYIPLTFILGFFVTIVVERWRQVFNNMGWIENVALTVSALFDSNSEDDTLKRRSVVRYCVLSQVLTFRDISMRVRRRFPNMESLVKGGFIHEHELKSLENVDLDYNKYWVPLNWAMSVCVKGHKEGRIVAPPSLNNVINEIRAFRTNLALLCNFDWVPIPIAYPQVVFLAVRVHFLICCVSRQYILTGDNVKSIIDLYFPFMTSLQFIFFVGWMKVAEALLNPLGEDDDDYECNFLIDKNIATGLAIVDSANSGHPELLPDKFLNKTFVPVYSEDSTRNGLDSALFGSAQLVTLAEPAEEVKMVSVDPKISMPDLFADEFNSSRRSTMSRIRRRTQPKISPMVELGVSLPPNFTLHSDRPNPANLYSKKRESNGMNSPVDFNSTHVLGKVDEEDLSNSKSSKSFKSSSDDEDDEVHEVIKNELNPPKY